MSGEDDPGPGPGVLLAFGASGPVRRLPGGRDGAFLVGDVVLKRVDDVEAAEWASDVLASLRPSGIVVPRPLSSRAGRWVVDGWQAAERADGAADETRVDDVIRAGDALAEALAGVPRPGLLDRADHPWARADRVAWGEASPPDDALVRRALGAVTPVADRAALMHGDLLGNVLFPVAGPPAVIDLSPYWRPVRWAAAIVVVDAIAWHRHPLASLGAARGISDWRSLVLRALVFRMTASRLLGVDDAARFTRLTEAALALPDS